jgi:ATP-binding cassette subfamily F protein 3
MITLRNITLRRGTKVVLQGASVTLQPGEKVGLIGRNGAGKSSLFSLITNRLHADAGDVEMPPRWRVGEVAQDMPETSDGATDFVLQGDLPLMAPRPNWPPPKPAATATPSRDAHMALDEAGCLRRRARAQALLLGLGFRTTSSTHRSTASAAAGACGCSWRAR